MPIMAGFSKYVIHEKIRAIIYGPQALAFIPAITLGCFWLGGEVALLVSALVIPVIIAIIGAPTTTTKTGMPEISSSLDLHERIETALDHVLHTSPKSGYTTAALVVELDDRSAIQDRLGHKAFGEILQKCLERLGGVLRESDVISRLDSATFAIALGPVRRADLETLIQMSTRLQTAISEPVSLNATTVYISCSVGFCLANRAPKPNGEAMLEAARIALNAAQTNGPGAIRAYSAEMQHEAIERHALIEDVEIALEEGQIEPWFQPQISTDTGKITGFEALARWNHPNRGMISPADFLPAIEQAGLSERLGEVILYQSLKCLKKWDQQGYLVPTVGVNFSSVELQNPKLVDKIRWELDRFNLGAERLAVEILETVVAKTDDDIITRNIADLATLGCAIDLDDFGTGHASIANIRRFAVGRIKIDRSFVMKVDTDPEQQRMVSAILTMAEQLDLETLGEGVETVGEHAMLAQLGCGHIQGFGLARPMPFEDTQQWIDSHNQKLAKTPKIGRHTG